MSMRYLTQGEKENSRRLYECCFPEDSQKFVDYYYQEKCRENEIAVIEENVQTGACGERVSEYVMRKMLPLHVLILALPDDYIEHGSVDVLRKMTGIDSESMSEKIIETYKEL